jgi:hypothetical protein
VPVDRRDEGVGEEERDNALDAVNRDLTMATGHRVEIIAIEDDDLRRMASVRGPLLETRAHGHRGQEPAEASVDMTTRDLLPRFM